MENVITNHSKKSLVQTFDELYLKKDFKGALDYLLKNKKEIDSGIFHYNVGTIYSKLGEHATARYHLEKAIQIGYVNSATINNLEFVKSQLKVDDLSTSINFPDKFINTVTSIPSGAYLSMTLALLVGAMVLMKMKMIIKKGGIVAAFFFALIPFLFSVFYVNNINYAVALVDIPIYEGPSKIFSEKGQIRAGSKIVLGQFKEGWFQVEFPISLSGWVYKDQLGRY